MIKPVPLCKWNRSDLNIADESHQNALDSTRIDWEKEDMALLDSDHDDSDVLKLGTLPKPFVD